MTWKRTCAWGLLLGVVSLCSASATASDCVSGKVDAGRLLQDSAIVFAGTLVEGDHYTLTFRPDRVWKGHATERATVYVLGHPFIGAYTFRPGIRYLVAARELQQDERRSIDLDDRVPEAFGFERPCGSPLPLSLLPELDRLPGPALAADDAWPPNLTG